MNQPVESGSAAGIVGLTLLEATPCTQPPGHSSQTPLLAIATPCTQSPGHSSQFPTPCYSHQGAQPPGALVTDSQPLASVTLSNNSPRITPALPW